jgi:peroxiredoxin
VLGVAVSERVPDPRVKMREFRKRHHVTYALVSDEKATVFHRFGFDGIPQSVVIDRQGRYAAAPSSVTAVAAKVAELLGRRG